MKLGRLNIQGVKSDFYDKGWDSHKFAARQR
jgi:hypothetical protein